MAPEQPPVSQARRRPRRKIWLALTSSDGNGVPPPPGTGRPKSKSLPGGAVVVHRMEKRSVGSMSMKEDLELLKEWLVSAGKGGGCAC